MKYYLTLILTLSLILTGCNIKPMVEEYDIIVVGSDPEAISAAIAAARSGANTLLIDSREKLGGLFTLGWLNFLDMNYGPGQTLLTRGIFEEFFNQIEGISFDIATAESTFNRMVNSENNIDLKLKATNIRPALKDNIMIGVYANIDNVEYQFSAKQVIDATQDCDIAAASGVPFTLGQEDIGGPTYGMAATQIFKLGGVKIEDWVKLKSHLNTDDDLNSGANINSAWGFARFYNDYKPSQENVQLRGLNIARQTDGCIMINALQIFQIDPLNEQSRILAKQKAITELEHIIPFLKKEVPGMQNIELLAVAPELYIRESRHMQTEYRLTLDDVLENRDYNDRIALGSYPVDMQGTKPGQDVIIIGNPQQYAIPLRSIIPLKIENLLLAGRSAGYDSLAHGSTRMVPIGMCTGEAAGTVAAMAIENNITVRDFTKNNSLIKSLQDRLIDNGAYLPAFKITDPNITDPYYNGLKLLRNYGLIQGRYQNNYHLKDKVTVGEYSTILTNLIKKDNWDLTINYSRSGSTEYLYKRDIAESLVAVPEIFNNLCMQQLWDKLLDSRPVTRGEMAQVLYLCKLALP